MRVWEGCKEVGGRVEVVQVCVDGETAVASEHELSFFMYHVDPCWECFGPIRY